MEKISPFQLKWAIVGMLVAAFFGISLDMGVTCLIPVSFLMLGGFGIKSTKGNSFEKSLLDGALPPFIGGLLIWLFFILKIWFNI